MSASLAARHPRDTPWLIVLWALTAISLALGLAVPAVKVTKLRLFDATHSVLSGIADLWYSESWPLAIIIAAFSVALPVLKLLVAAFLWLTPYHRTGPLHALAVSIGKWSMLDVLVVAIIVVSLQGDFLVRFRAQSGIYLFGASALFAMALMAWIDRRRRQADAQARR
jgi:paraquat-inducible protein A